MKARVSADPKVDKDHDDPNKDSQGQDENQVEEEDLAIVATLQEDQEEEVHDSQSEMRASFRSEGVEQPPCNPNQPTDIRPVRGQMPEDDPEDPVGEALIKRKSDIWKMIGEVCDEGLKFTDGTEKEEQKATTQALVGVTKTLEVQIKSHLKKIKLETRTLKRRLKKKKKRKLKKEGALGSCVSDTNNGAGTSAEARVPNPLIKIAGSKIYISGEALAAHRGTDTDGGTNAGTGAGSMETEAQEPNAEVEKHKVDALLSMNDARLEHLIGRDNYMAITQAQAQEAQESVIASGTADAPETDRQMRVRQRNIKRRKKEKEDERKKAKKTKEDESKAGPSNWRRSGDGPGSGRWGDMTTGEEQVVTDLVTEEELMVRDLCNITGCTEEQCAEALATHSSENRSREEIWSFAYDMLKLIL